MDFTLQNKTSKGVQESRITTKEYLGTSLRMLLKMVLNSIWLRENKDKIEVFVR